MPTRPMSEAERLVESLGKLLQTAELTMDDLVAASVLPRNLTESFLSDLRVTLASLADRPNDLELAARASDNILTLQKGLIDSQDDLLRAIFLLERVVADMRLEGSRREILGRMARYFDTRGATTVIWSGLYQALQNQPAQVYLGGNADSVEAVTVQLNAWRKMVQGAPSLGVGPERRMGRWEYWHQEVREFLTRRDARPANVLYVDYALAAADLPPGNLFRISLTDMQQVDWSRAVLAALPRTDNPPEAPYWLLFGALAALGFDRDSLFRLLESEPPSPLQPTSEQLAAAAEIIPYAARRPTGVLHVYSDRPGDPLPLEIPGTRPMLSVGASKFEVFLPALNWLYSNELFDEGRDETD